MAEINSGLPQNSKDGERKCKVCGLQFPNIYAYAEHLESNEHTKGIMKKKYGAKYLEAKAQLFENSEQGKQNNLHTDVKCNNVASYTNRGREDQVLKKETSVKGENVTNGESDSCDTSDDDGEVYTCKECRKICTGVLNYKLHLSGRKHQKTVKRNKMIKNMQKKNMLPESTAEDKILDFNDDEAYASNEIICKTCNKTFTGPQSFKQHIESEGHRKKLAVPKEIPEHKANVDLDDSNEDYENTPFAKCESCSKSFSGPIPYQQHMESTVHFKQIRQLKNLAKFKDASVCSDKNKLYCKDCNKYFSGPLPYKNHITGATHVKKQEKNKLIKSLQENYKEMTIMHDSTQMSSSDENEEQIISCNICHVAFSGPQSAQDHFQSQKHKKAAKEKKRIQKLTKDQKLVCNNKSLLDSDKNGCESDESFDIIG